MLQEGKSNSWAGQTVKLRTQFSDSKMQSGQFGEELSVGENKTTGKPQI